MKKNSVLHIILSTMLMISGCHTSAAPMTRTDVIGRYHYVSDSPDTIKTEHQWDQLALESDGTFDLVEGGPTKAKSEKKGTWTIWDGTPSQVILGKDSFPVVRNGHEIRLMISYDEGIWYAKD